MLASILISSHNRSALLKRTLASIAAFPPPVDFEVVLVDDASTEDTLGVVRGFSSRLSWTFIRFDAKEFAKQTGFRKFLNNPCVTNNIAYRYSQGSLLFLQGNEVMAGPKCYAALMAAAPLGPHWAMMSTTYDIPPEVVGKLGEYQAELTYQQMAVSQRYPLQSRDYRSDVTNYISLAPRSLWDSVCGYDERYFSGIAAEDSDFVRRARTLPDFQMQVSHQAISYHQSHGGKTCYYDPPSSYITQERWQEGCRLNRIWYDAWDGTYRNHTPWEIGSIGIAEVITNQ
jgi:GT2 family glycosyltransferase